MSEETIIIISIVLSTVAILINVCSLWTLHKINKSAKELDEEIASRRNN